MARRGSFRAAVQHEVQKERTRLAFGFVRCCYNPSSFFTEGHQTTSPICRLPTPIRQTRSQQFGATALRSLRRARLWPPTAARQRRPRNGRGDREHWLLALRCGFSSGKQGNHAGKDSQQAVAHRKLEKVKRSRELSGKEGWDRRAAVGGGVDQREDSGSLTRGGRRYERADATGQYHALRGSGEYTCDEKRNNGANPQGEKNAADR